MGKRTGTGNRPSTPTKRKQFKSPFWLLVKIVGWVVIAAAVLFGAMAFYYSGEIRNGALVPPDNYDHEYELVVSDVSGDRVSVTDTGSNGEIGEPGVEGIGWADGYVTTEELVSTIDGDDRRTDVRRVLEGGTPPAVGTNVRLDPHAFPVDPEQAFGLPFETVRYTSDIDSFPAWFIDGPSSTWAVIVHGKGADLTEALRIVPFLHARGYPILVIHYRNDPGSAADPSGYHQFGATEWKDLDGAIRFAEENGASDHIVIGYSMGGSVVTSYLAQSRLRNRTIAAILDSPALSLERTIDHQASNTEMPVIGTSIPESLGSAAKWIASWRFDVNWDQTDYLAQSASLHTPMLIFHGTNDLSVPFETSQEMAELRPDITTLVKTQAGHVRSWNESPDKYETAIDEFFAGLD